MTYEHLGTRLSHYMISLSHYFDIFSERVAEWLRRLTHKPKVRTAVGSNPTLDSLVAVRYTSPGQPEPCEGNLVAVAGSCGGVMIKHPWPLLEISLSDFRGLATLNINTYRFENCLKAGICRVKQHNQILNSMVLLCETKF